MKKAHEPRVINGELMELWIQTSRQKEIYQDEEKNATSRPSEELGKERGL